MTRLDHFLPQFTHNEVHETSIAATPETLSRAIRAVTGRELALARTLFAIRELPGWLLGRPRLSRDSGRPILETAIAGGFMILSDEPGEIVIGVVGQFWTPTGGITRLSGPEEFLAFSREGYAKSAMNICWGLREDGRGYVRTETRILPLGRTAKRRFGLYWFFVHPGSALLRRSWLRAIRRRAEGHDETPPSFV